MPLKQSDDNSFWCDGNEYPELLTPFFPNAITADRNIRQLLYLKQLAFCCNRLMVGLDTHKERTVPKMRVELAGISGFRSLPYPIFGGMVRSRFPPTCMPTIPSSHPKQNSYGSDNCGTSTTVYTPLITSL
jgi:hypothetical protein